MRSGCQQAEGRISSLIEELRALLAQNPALADRTRALLVGVLPCPDLLREGRSVRNARVTRLLLRILTCEVALREIEGDQGAVIEVLRAKQALAGLLRWDARDRR